MAFIRQATNGIVNSELYLRNQERYGKPTKNVEQKGLLSRAKNDTMQSDTPLPIELKLRIREAFNNA